LVAEAVGRGSCRLREAHAVTEKRNGPRGEARAAVRRRSDAITSRRPRHGTGVRVTEVLAFTLAAVLKLLCLPNVPYTFSTPTVAGSPSATWPEP
jgi:hypothetical protein